MTKRAYIASAEMRYQKLDRALCDMVYQKKILENLAAPKAIKYCEFSPSTPLLIRMWKSWGSKLSASVNMVNETNICCVTKYLPALPG